MIKRVVSKLCVICLLATRFIFVTVAEEDDTPIEYIRVDIPTYSYNAFQYWFNNGYKRFSVPKDDMGNPLFNSSGISAMQSINVSSTQANSTYTESESYNLNGNISENVRGSLYAQASTGTGGTINYNITTGAGSAVGNLPITGTESITGTSSASGTIVNGNITSSGNTSIVGMSESQITYIYNLPWLEGSYVHSNSFVRDKSVYVNGAYDTYVSFYASKNIFVGNNNATLAGLANYTLDPNLPADISATRVNYAGTTSYFCTLRIHAVINNNQGYTLLTLDFPGIDANTKIIPLYVGNGVDLTDDQKSMFQIATNLETTIINESNESQTLLTSGDNTSKGAENHVNNSNNSLNNKVSTLEGYESTFNSNLNSSLSNISLPNVNGVVKFGNAARWVSTQYTRIANDQRINFPLIFCLTLGLALTILGRIRT